jgi:predicted metal-binding protein
MNQSYYISTPKHKLKIDAYFDFIKVSDIQVDKDKFFKMCKEGCVNFGNKYSCPPCSPSLTKYVKEKEVLVLMMKIDLDQFDSNYREYLKLQAGNAVLKSQIERLMRKLEVSLGGKFLATGSCRLCKPCRLKLKEPCRDPLKRRYSLESLGVDCDSLVKTLFKTPLLWYKDKKSPSYTSVVCGLPVKSREGVVEELKSNLC